VEEAETRLILMTLEHTRDNKTRAAEILGISLKTLHNKLNKLRGRLPGKRKETSERTDAPQHPGLMCQLTDLLQNYGWAMAFLNVFLLSRCSQRTPPGLEVSANLLPVTKSESAV
jgi:hypothetical protein